MNKPYPEEMFQEGSHGSNVAAIQAILGVQPTAVFGPTTEEMVIKFQRTHDLTPDGIVGPKTWDALFNQKKTNNLEDVSKLAEMAVQIATGYDWVREKPAGSNRGEEVDRFNQTVGVPEGSSWCGSFVYTCFEEASEKLGVKNPLPKPATASCQLLFEWAKKHGYLTTRPRRGDIFIAYNSEGHHYHQGLVRAVSNSHPGYFSSVEGNSNNDGSANGYEVAQRTFARRNSSCHFVRVPDSK